MPKNSPTFHQPSLIQDSEQNAGQPDFIIGSFSHERVCEEAARLDLERRYSHLFEETEKFSRRLVSFQANKTETLHSWFKYREGFSADLVEILLNEFNIEAGNTVFDPFAGSSTTLLEAMMLGINSMGVELLPHCHVAFDAKSRAFQYSTDELIHLRDLFENTNPPVSTDPFPHLTITQSAFPSETERELMGYKQWIEQLDMSQDARILLQMILISVLEDVSYTRKDGQYLRWDKRSEKLIKRNKERKKRGIEKETGIDKGNLPTVQTAFVQALNKIIHDITALQVETPPPSNCELMQGNLLHVLPRLEPDQFDAVITSPPYANRYDYTRTYALELAFLGVDQDIFSLRQGQLSCTVENKSKLEQLAELYTLMGQRSRYEEFVDIAKSSAALNEINQALSTRFTRNEINNQGVLPMIEQYFTELLFVFGELFRTCHSGAYVAFVNDNVRYAGEIVPVDTLSTDLATRVGFVPVKIYVLPQRKGNSSQQMGKFGRVALRKSITVWRKP